MLATPSATRQSPVGSAASAAVKEVIGNNTDKKIAVFTMFLGQCNIGQTCACVADKNEGKTPHWAFSVDENATEPKYVVDGKFKSRRFRAVCAAAGAA
jgi:hypothetical protein